MIDRWRPHPTCIKNPRTWNASAYLSNVWQISALSSRVTCARSAPIRRASSLWFIVQVNGKLRATAKAPKDASKSDMESIARAAVASHLDGKEIVKTVVVPGRLVNFVVR